MSADVVVFAGAGASAASGYAQTGEILPEVLRRLKRRAFEHPELKDGKELLARAHAILPGLASDDFEGIELADLVSILDHCIAEGEALGPGLEAGDLLAMRRSLDLAMAEVLARPLGSGPASVSAEEFARALVERFVAGGRRLAIVSPNHDVSLDLAMFRELEAAGIDPRAQVDLGFTRRDGVSGELVPPPARPALALYKLHGALNWLLCERCGCVTVDFERGATSRAGRACACGHAPMQMLLVAPSLVRDVRDVNLRGTWQSAQEALRTASLWIFIGFSLRGEDLAIRSMLARARLASEAVARRILVVGKEDDPPPGIGLFLGDFEYLAGGLESWLDPRHA
jgi:hypothetical protein